MNVRTRIVCLLGLAVSIGGCAGGPGPQAIQPEPAADEDLPAWVLALPEGTPPSDNSQTGTVQLYLTQGRFQDALDEAQQGIQRDSTNAQFYFQAGEAYLQLGQYAEADRMFDRAQVIYPRYAYDVSFVKEGKWIDAYNGAVSAMQASDTTAAIAGFEEANEIYQGRPEAMMQLGALYSMAGRTADAAAMFGEAVDMIEGPLADRVDDPELQASMADDLDIARFQRGQLLFELEQYAEAADVYQEIVDENPQDLMAAGNLGASLIAAGETDRAAAVYDALLARPDLGVRDLNTIGVGAYNGDLFHQAADAFGRAAELLPENRDFLFNQAQSLYLAEDSPAELEEVSRRLIELDPNSRIARQFLANGLIGLERQQDAVAVLEDMEAMPFELDNLQLVGAEGGYVVQGEITNWNSEPGSDVTVEFRFYDESGVQVGQQDQTFTLGEAEQPTTFEVQFPTTTDVFGYNYVVM
jgi:tetratricopeptide (TPR) repeat protein